MYVKEGTSTEDFDLSKLSEREAEILNLAIEGMTDQQIAHLLAISVSTVNSYWVRIRGKVGFFSRTELAAKCLRAKSQAEMKVVMAQSDKYQRQAEQNEKDVEALQNAEWCRAGLAAMPEAIMVLDRNGKILYANGLLERLFGYEEGRLAGMAGEALIFSHQNEHLRELEAFFLHPQRTTLGINRVIYGRHRSGGRVRIMLLLGSSETSQGRVFTAIVRDFLDEVNALRRRAAAMLS